VIPRLSPPFDLGDALALCRGLVTSGGVAAFETAMAAYTKKSHALAFPHGRSGFLAFIRAMGWKDREIVLPAYTCVVMPNVILASGNRPRFVDIELGNFNASWNSLSQAITSQAACVVPTHCYGFPAEVAEAQPPQGGPPAYTLLQDCALAFGATKNGLPVWRDGLAALFSFSIGKHISCVEGGMIVTDDDDLAREMLRIRDITFSRPMLSRSLAQSAFFFASWLGLTPFVYGLVHFLATKTPLLNFLTDYYDEDAVRMPSSLTEHLPECLGVLGARQVTSIERIVARKRYIASRYLKALEGVSGITPPPFIEGASWSHFPCLVDDRRSFLSYMFGKGIHVGIEVFNYSIPDMPLYRPFAHDGVFPNTRHVAAHLVLIPNHARLSDAHVERIARALSHYQNQRGTRRHDLPHRC